MTLKELLISKYGFSEKVTDDILKYSRMKNGELVARKLEDMFDFLGFDFETQKKIILKWPHTLNLSPDNIKKKAEFFKNEYGITNAQFKSMIKINFAPMHSAESKILELEKYYNKNFGMTRAQFCAKMRHAPGFVGIPIDSVEKKNSYVAEKFAMTHSDLEKLVKSGSNYPSISVDKIDDMYEFFNKEFSMSAGRFGKLLVSGKPISYTKEKIMNTYNVLRDKFDFSKDNFGVMISKCQTTLGLAPESLIKRIEKLQELGFSIGDIVDNSRVLSLNSNKLKTRYILSKLNGFSDYRFLSKGFMFNDKTIYQRMAWLDSQGMGLTHLYDSEAKFQHFAKVKNVNIYSDDVDIVSVRKRLLNEYNEKFGDSLVVYEEELYD